MSECVGTLVALCAHGAVEKSARGQAGGRGALFQPALVDRSCLGQCRSGGGERGRRRRRGGDESDYDGASFDPGGSLGRPGGRIGGRGGGDRGPLDLANVDGPVSRD